MFRVTWPRYQEIKESVRKVKAPCLGQIGIHPTLQKSHSQKTTGRAGISEDIRKSAIGDVQTGRKLVISQTLELMPFTFWFYSPLCLPILC